MEPTGVGAPVEQVQANSTTAHTKEACPSMAEYVAPHKEDSGQSDIQAAALVGHVKELLADADEERLPVFKAADHLTAEFGLSFDIDDPDDYSDRKAYVKITGPLLSRILYHADLLPHPRIGDVVWVTEDEHGRIMSEDADRYARELVERARAREDKRDGRDVSVPSVEIPIILRYSPSNARKRAAKERDQPIEPLLSDRAE